MSDRPNFMRQAAGEMGDPGRTLDPERLKSITATFAAPQTGLGLAAFGGAYAASEMLSLYWLGSPWTGLGLLLIVGAVLGWFIYIPRYYVSRFGWVQQKPSPVNPAKEVGLVILFGLLFAIWLTANLLQSLVVLRMPVNFLTLLQSVGFLCLILGVAFTARGRAMPARLTIWALLAVVQAVVAVLPLWVSLSPRQVLLWKLLNAGSLGILIMVMGLSNHVAMLRMLPKRVEEDQHE